MLQFRDPSLSISLIFLDVSTILVNCGECATGGFAEVVVCLIFLEIDILDATAATREQC